MRAPATILFVSCVTAGVVACSQSGHFPRRVAGGTAQIVGTSVDFAGTFPRAWCEHQVTCRLSPSVESCLIDHFYSGQPYLFEMFQKIDSGRYLYDSRQGGLCANALATAGCSLAENEAGNQIRLACDGMLEGTVPSGGECVDSAECTTYNCIRSQCGSSCCLGTCADSSEVGTRCTDPAACLPSNHCTAGSFVTGTGQYLDTGTCQPLLDLGQSCGAVGQVCRPGLDCDSTTGLCAPFPKDGQVCSANGARCDNQGSYCTGTPGICRPRDEPGASCSFPTGATESCVDYSYCQILSSKDGMPSASVCVLYPGIGQSCASSANSFRTSCSCENGICRYPSTPPCTVETAVRPDAGGRD
jgi:hypothetical protein